MLNPARLPAAIGAALLVLSTQTTSAQVAALTADLLPGESVAGSFPRSFHNLGERTVFTISHGEARQLWGTDGTVAGTEEISPPCRFDICYAVAAVGRGRAYFVFDEELDQFDEERSLWATDGTREGTVQIASTIDGSSLVFPDEDDVEEPGPSPDYVLVGDRLFFVKRGSSVELWASDGTISGTVRVRGDFEADIWDLTAFGDQLCFFVGNRFSSSSPQELWCSDGTPAGTRPMLTLTSPLFLRATAHTLFYFHIDVSGATLFAADGSTSPPLELGHFRRLSTELPFDVTRPRTVGNRLYFQADDGVSGFELWSSDGTPSGTQAVTSFASAQPFVLLSFFERYFAGVGDSALFAVSANSTVELWTTRGTKNSTRRLEGVRPLTPFFESDRFVFFMGTDTAGTELWAFDGRSAPYRVVDLCPGPCSGVFRLAANRNEALLSGQTASPIRQIWSSNGTPGNIQRLTHFTLTRSVDVRGGFSDRRFGSWIGTVGETHVLSLSDEDHGAELFAIDRTGNGTRLAGDLSVAPANGIPRDLTGLRGGVLYTTCLANRRRELQWLNPVTGERRSLITLPRDFCNSELFPSHEFFDPLPIKVVGDLAYFRFSPSSVSKMQLWRTDGTAEGTIPVTEFPAQVCPCLESEVFELGGVPVFVVRARRGADLVQELWSTDGSVAGTDTLTPFPLAAREFINAWGVAGRVFLWARNADFEPQLWSSDGTPQGTHQVTDVASGVAVVGSPMTMGNLALLFLEEDFPSFTQLWRSDGTPAGTSLVRDRVSPREHGDNLIAAVAGGKLFFLSGSTLWTSDGTPEGTVAVRDLTPCNDFQLCDPGAMVALDHRVFFVFADEEHGRELWQSDGSFEGTLLSGDIRPGTRGADPDDLHAAGGRVWFTADDGRHGRELWVSDGGPPKLVQDIAPGRVDSEPEILGATGSGLFFSAHDGLFGEELWSLPLGGDTPCTATTRTLCLNESRFQASMAWRPQPRQLLPANATALTADTGYFHFLNPNNVEAIVKLLDGTGLNNRFWTFLGALTDTEYFVTVTDGVTGAARRYFNPGGNFASFADTGAFAPAVAETSALVDLARESGFGELTTVEERFELAARGSGCAPASNRLCLRAGRFAVEASWRDFEGESGSGSAVAMTDDTGYFWFFRETNVEVVFKVVDGTALNGRFWAFYGALSSVEYTLTVTDTQTGMVRTYRNPAGTLASVGDTGAF